MPPLKAREIDGSDTNGGETRAILTRRSTPDYPGDGTGRTMFGEDDLPNARDISNACLSQSESLVNSHDLTDMIWAFGQFLE